jgi:DNA gyrase subunit A
VLTVQYDSKRGRLVGAVIVDEDDELYAITSAGGVIRTSAREVRKAGRQTKGVRLMNLSEGTTLVAIARSAEEASPEPGTVATDVAELPAEGNASDEQGVIIEDGDMPAEDGEAPAESQE